MSVVLSMQQKGWIIIPDFKRSSALTITTTASFIQKHALYEGRQLFYLIKRISSIVASAVGLWPCNGWSVRHPPVSAA